jgi:hypothetical protein
VSRARLGALLLIGIAAVGGGVASAQGEGERSALVVLVPGASFEDLMAVPDVAALARAGGAGLLVNPDDVEVFEGTSVAGEDLLVIDPGEADEFAQIVRDRVERAGGVFDPATDGEVMIIAVGADPRDPGTIGGIVLAQGALEELFPDQGQQGSLTSDSTRRDGVVTGGDVTPTLAGFLGPEVEVAGSSGSPIEIIPGPPPLELNERYLAQRRMYVPVGTAAAIYLAVAGLGAIAILALGERVPSGIRRVFGWAGLSVPALATALLAAGHLPELTYATVVPFVALVTVFGTLAFAPLERREVLLVPMGIGIAVLAFFAFEAVLEWSAALTPFVGGAQLDGGRFYGLPNVFLGVLIGSSLWVAHRLSTAAGVGLLVAVALFAGLPYLGSDFGGGFTLFVTAGIWLAVRERPRLGVWKGLGIVAGVTLLGTALILTAHAISPLETHVTEFEQGVSGLGGVVERFVDRLQVGFDLIALNPFALVPVLGLPVAIAAVLWPPAPLRPSLERSPAWRDAILVCLLAGVVAYLANDTGPAAAGFAFGMGLGGLLGVSLLLGAEKMVNR